MYKKSFFERNPKKTLLIFISIAFVIIDLSFKGTLNLYNVIFYNDSIKDIVISHENYHHTFKPNKKVKVHSEKGNYTITTNSLGFKDDKVRDIEKKIDKERIILIGDSFTEGVLLDFEKTFAGIFKNHLASQNIDLLNAGRGGYSPIIYWAKIKHLIEIEKLKFNELYVFIDLSDTWDEYYIFDLDENSNVMLKNPNNSNQNITENFVGKIKVKLKENTFLTYLVLNYIYDVFKNNDEDKKWYLNIVNEIHYDKWTINKSIYDSWGEEGIKLQIQYMHKLKNLLDENGIDLTVVVYPWISQIWHEDLNSLQVKIWQDWSKKNSTNFINLFPLFVKKNIPDSKKDNIINDNFIKRDFHFNEKGNMIIAEELIERFENK